MFFITIHWPTRGRLSSRLGSGELLMKSVRHIMRGRWLPLFLLMPITLMPCWRFRLTNRCDGDFRLEALCRAICRIKWQHDFFDHRIRPGENWQLKADTFALILFVRALHRASKAGPGYFPPDQPGWAVRVGRSPSRPEFSLRSPVLRSFPNHLFNSGRLESRPTFGLVPIALLAPRFQITRN